MGARGPLGLIARLELRHARSDLRFLLFAAGTDIDEDRGFLERAYQLYLLAIFAVVLALSWGQVVYLVEGMRDALGQGPTSPGSPASCPRAPCSPSSSSGASS